MASAQDLVDAIAGKQIAGGPVRRPRVAALPAVDIVILTIRAKQLCVLLIRRGKVPHRGKSALPGGFLRPGESLEKAAARKLLRRCVEDARTLLEHTTVAADFCPRKFTISDLRGVYEAVWGVSLNPQNFQRRIRDVKGFVVPTHELRDGRQGRPAELFRRGPAKILDPPMLRPRTRATAGR